MGKRLISLILTLTFISSAFGTMPIKAENEQTGIVAHDEVELTLAAEPDTIAEAEISDGQELPSFSDEIETFSEENDVQLFSDIEIEDITVIPGIIMGSQSGTFGSIGKVNNSLSIKNVLGGI